MLGRLRTICGAYLIASIVAAFVIALGGLFTALVRMLRDGAWQQAGAYALTGPIWLIMYGGIVSMFVVVFAFVPALLVIGVAEAARVRSAAFYGCAGAIAAVALSYVLVFKDEWTVVSTTAVVASVLIVGAAGLAGGLAYWIVAGTSAGDWRAPATKVATD